MERSSVSSRSQRSLRLSVCPTDERQRHLAVVHKNEGSPGGPLKFHSTCSRGQFPPNHPLVGLGKSCPGLDTQPPRIVEQLIHALVGNLPVEQFAHAWLGLCEDHLQLLVRILSRVLQDGLVQVRLELQDRGLLGRKSQVIEHIAPRHVSWLTARHAFSPESSWPAPP